MTITSVKTFITSFFTLLLCSLSQAEGSPTPTGKVFTYKETNGVKRELEVFFPDGHDPSKQAVPAIVFFHGGAWVKGGRGSFSHQCAYFAKRGIVAATVTYRLVSAKDRKAIKDKTSFKRLCIPDAKSAIRWMKEQSGKIGVDPTKIILSGGSAGGHICLIASHNEGLNDPNDNLKFDTSAFAYILFNPALTKNANDKEVHFIQHLNSNTAPAIAFFGDKDKWLNGWNPAYKKWKSLSPKTIEVHMAIGEDHAFFNQKAWRNLTLLAADQFLQKHGILKGKPLLSSPIDGKKLTLLKP